MKKVILALFVCLAIFSKAWSADTPATRNLMPVPAEVTWKDGSLKIDADFNVAVKGDSEPRVENAVKRFTERLGKRTHLALSSAAKDSKTSLSITFEDKGLPVQSVKEDESYTLTVTSKQAVLSAPNPLGILHGLQTLLQLVEKQGDAYVLPAVTIHDKPRFAWRGLLIDVCRHFHTVEVLKHNLDGLEEAKMNVFHWHLSEDQGIRVESKKFPKLQELGSDGKFYTQEDIKEVVAYARDRGIRVVPEFDIPGHSTALVTAYPELASAPGPYTIERKFGIFDPALDPTNEAVYAFLKDFIAEMAALFPDDYFHIGGDEVSGKQWNENAKIQAFMFKHHFKTNDELQTYFNGRILPFITESGKKMVGWDEILTPGLPKTAVVHSWRGIDSVIESGKKGYDTILSNGLYLNHQLAAAVYYAVDPLPATTSLTPEQASHVLGGEDCMWSEYVTDETMDSRIWPRTLAVAERFWSDGSVKDAEDMYRRMNAESVRLEEVGLVHRSNYLPMLDRLVGKDGESALKVLADVVQPQKYYLRPRYRAFTSLMPLTRLADAARPETETARLFRNKVNKFLANAPEIGDSAPLVSDLELWKGNHKKLLPFLEKSDESMEMASRSEDLSTSAQFGLEAVKYLKSGKPAPAAWQEKAKEALDRAQIPHVEVDLKVVDPIRKLVLAVEQLDKLKEMKADEWNKSLDEQVLIINPEPKR